MRFRLIAAAVVSVGILVAGNRVAADTRLTVSVGQPAHAVSPRLVGIFIEDINFGADGGLNAELVKNGSFEFPRALMGWSERGTGSNEQGAGSLEVSSGDPAFAANPHYLRITASRAGYGAESEGFRGMGVRGGEKYVFSATARAPEGTATLRLALIAEDGRELASAEIADIDGQWSEHSTVLEASDTEAKARLAVTLASPGTVDLDMVSLYPEKTWLGRPHGQRADLVEMLAAMKPAFFRFPGGCIVEGSRLDDRYQWKLTIGDRPDRRLTFNRWNTVFGHRPTPDYFQSFGVGFFEYFQLAEDMGAEPLPILNCGMACQFQSGELVPLDELQPFIQDALDLIEFANGPVTSTWGAKRAAMGHPEPFDMKLLGVGNEQWGPEYFERYEIFATVLREKHPEIELVSASGPFPNDRHFHYAWPRLRAMPLDEAGIVDEHCYAMPDWFLRAATRYDDRTFYKTDGPKVFMGEYAAQSIDISSPDNRNNLRCALAEAAFLTGIERNSDVVVMSSYAPLFGHVDAWQWRPNLIWFDNLNVYGTPNYYVQQLFSLHRGDVVLPVDLADSRPPEPPQGRIGLGSYQTSVEFKDIRVTRGEETLFEGESLDASELTTFRGRWEVEDGVVRQRDPGISTRALFGDPAWRDYTLSLKARKLSGREGFVVIFRSGSGGSYVEWNVGGWRNSQHGILAHIASHSQDDTLVEQVAGTIEDERWYDVRVELAGSRVRCYLDDELVHDLDIPGPELPRLYASASQVEESDEVILKIVNPTDEDTRVEVRLEGVSGVDLSARAIVLAGHPADENSIAEPEKIAPSEKEVDVGGPRFHHRFPPHSFTVLRLNVE